MYTIKNNNHNEIIIKNSRFICYLYKIKDKSEVNDIINNIKESNKDANHYCYAYIVDDYKKSSDDGEPSGTAGIPILKVLEANNLNNILAVVVRYFGGILLGAGGLVRAYTKSVTNTLSSDNIVKLTKGYNIDIEFNYNKIKEIDYLLKDININNKIFDNTIKYNIDIPISFIDTIKLNKINYKILKDINIEYNYLSNK
ncbi:MAG: YigZ family protein [Bacilli bacterium]|nr:YigZ family protein [Bacilli bacterium]